MRAGVFIFFLMLSVSATRCISQTISKQQYIDMYKDIAIKEMRRTGVPAAITLAQAILESENGNSDLTKRSNNHFGIKCKSNWTGPTVYHDDDAAGECFRAYSSAEESFKDHSDFLKYREPYAFLFLLDPADYKGWAYGLRKAGYATNPHYPDILIQNIENYGLQQYTLIGLNQVKTDSTSTCKDDSTVMNTNKPVPNITHTTDSSFHQTLPVKTERLRVVYTVQTGDDLYAICKKYRIALNDIKSWNNLIDEKLRQGQLLIVSK